MADQPKAELPEFAFASQKAWEKWLKTNHLSSPGIWLQIAKKGSGTSSVTYAEAIEVALCYGWIYGPKKAPQRRGMAAEIHSPRQKKHLVEDQPRKSARPHREQPNAGSRFSRN